MSHTDVSSVVPVSTVSPLLFIPEVILKYHKKHEHLESEVKQILKEEEEERQVGGTSTRMGWG